MSHSDPSGAEPPAHDGEDLWERAQEVFAEWLEQVEEQVGPADVQVLCARHPELGPALQTLHDAWSQMEAAFASAPVEPTEGLDPPADGPASARYVDPRPAQPGEIGGDHSVFDRHLGRRVAMRVLHRDGTARPDPASLKRFLAEARATAGLSHPNVLPLLDLGVDAEDRPFFTTPLLEGVDLQSALQAHHDGDPRWSRAQVLDVLVRVCDALAHAHGQGRVHGSLDAADVLLGRFGAVYVQGWGRAPTDRDDGSRTAQADVRAVGRLLHALSATRSAAQLAAICTRALAAHGDAGYPSMLALRDDLIAFRELRAVQAYRTGAWAELAAWVARNRAVAAIALLAMVALGVALVVLTQERQRADRDAEVAERGLHTASESVDRLLARLGQGVLRSAPRIDEVSADLLAQALQLHERVLALRPGNPNARRRFAAALDRLAAAARANGQHAFERAMLARRSGMLRALLAEADPGAPAEGVDAVTLRDELAGCLTDAAHAALRTGSASVCLDAVEQILAEFGSGAGPATTGNLSHRLAAAHRLRGAALAALGDAEAALHACTQARELLQPIARLRGDPAARTLGLEVLGDLVDLAHATGDEGAVEQAVREGLALLDGDQPSATREERLAGLAFCRRAASARTGSDDPAARRPWLDRAVLIARGLARDFPNRRDSSRLLAECLAASAELAADQERRDEADELFTEATRMSRQAVDLAPREAPARRAFSQVHEAAYRHWIGLEDWDRACDLSLAETRRAPTADLRLAAATRLAGLIAHSDRAEPPLLDALKRGLCRNACLLVVQEHRARLTRGESSGLAAALARPEWRTLREEPGFRSSEPGARDGR